MKCMRAGLLLLLLLLLLLSGYGQSVRMRLEVTIVEKPITLEPGDANSSDFKAEVTECIAKIDRVRKQMEIDQDEIDRLKLETREILARLKAA